MGRCDRLDRLRAIFPRGSKSRAAEHDCRFVWSDDFERDGALDPQSWEFERVFVRNQELQWYQPETAFCREGFWPWKRGVSASLVEFRAEAPWRTLMTLINSARDLPAWTFSPSGSLRQGSSAKA